jgi:biotin carboxyl carrier protein
MEEPGVRLAVTIGELTEAVEVQPLAAGGRFRVTVGGRAREVDLVELSGGALSLLIDGESRDVRLQKVGDAMRVWTGGQHFWVEVADEWRRRLETSTARAKPHTQQIVTAPMPGRVLRLLVGPGKEVREGEGLLVVEAMKMENELKSVSSGRVVEVAVAEGQAIEGGARLVVIE